jgi:hypothetical protein
MDKWQEDVAAWSSLQCMFIGLLLAIWWQMVTMAMDVLLWKLLGL